MPFDHPPLPPGYSPVPAGHIANTATYLEMRAKPRPRPAGLPPPRIALEAMAREDLAGYRALFRAVGEEWLWSSRLVMADAELAAILGHPDIEAFALTQGGRRVGLLELDFRTAGVCELAFFGLIGPAVGHGLGRYLMDRAIARAFARPIERFWVHTCNFDHPGALAFYRRSGFAPYALAVEVMEDPRLTGVLPPTAAPHVPLGLRR